jgi:phosphoesterase RecJ-like protein
MLQPLADWRIWADFAADAAAFGALVVLDTCSNSQLEPVAEFLTRAPRTLVIDHHATRDAIGTRAGDWRLIDESASANALILAEWALHERILLTPAIAAALLVGIATDCGWFRFSNADARTLRAAAELANRGVKLDELHAALYQQEPVAKLRLIGLLLGSLEMHANGRLAVMYVRPADFAKAGADRGMTEDLVNEAGRAAGVECTLLFCEEDNGEIRVNLRSRKQIDVAAIARIHGGGGHARAAGCRLRGAWDEVVPAFVARVAGMLESGA